MKVLSFTIAGISLALAACSGNHVTGLPKYDSAHHGHPYPADTSVHSKTFGSSSGSLKNGSDTSATKN
jgi:hypothetical protein